MNEKQVQIPTLDSLLADPGKVFDLSPDAAQILLIGLVSLQPLLVQRALMGTQGEQEKDLVLTVPQVAKRLKLSSYRVYELARRGNLKSVRLGKSVRVRPSAVAEYLAQQGAGH
jgi:excisionase family DNA binding protein